MVSLDDVDDSLHGEVKEECETFGEVEKVFVLMMMTRDF